MTDPRSVLTPEALTMMVAIAQNGSFAAAARQLGKVPSALTYSVRQLEDALDVLLFDRRSRQATLTAAGQELLDEGRHLLEQIDAVANRVKRVATGWETQLVVAVDDVISRATILELCEAFYASVVSDARSTRGRPAAALPGGSSSPPTRLRIRTEVLAGTWEALISGQADLAIGVGVGHELPSGVAMKDLGTVDFVFAVAPHHPLAAAAEPIGDAELVRHRAVAVADSAHRLTPITLSLLPGQDVLTVSDMQGKIDAQLRGIGCGFVPEPATRDHIAAGRLVVKSVERQRSAARLGYAWRQQAGGRAGSTRKPQAGLALRWWLDRLETPATRRGLLERHGSRFGSGEPPAVAAGEGR
ncbi:MAG TPA: LysR substrate-binding domain-containing protein [Caldimonas sp.]|nr:LysR substrate-binding domain-containing protein [Caldimonas sp.]HEX2540591.1 LysR substrate-binding domain-containing protein [Caldimonas sp.]